MRLFTESDVRAALAVGPLIDALDAAFLAKAEGRVTNHPRTRVVGGHGGTLQLMSAGWRDENIMGYKAYATGAHGVEFRVFLHDGAGRAMAAFEADTLGALRTGAASGLATRHMARPDAASVAILGSGGQARTQLAAVCAVRAIRDATVFSRTPARREHFAAEMKRTLGVPVTAVATAEEATAGRDIVCVITTAREPVLAGRWLAAGAHVNAAGVNRIDKREIDADVVRRAARVVADDVPQARMECGDLAFAVREGAFAWDDLLELADVISGRTPGRANAEEITLFESQGIALEDIVAAKIVYDAAAKKENEHP